MSGTSCEAYRCRVEGLPLLQGSVNTSGSEWTSSLLNEAQPLSPLTNPNLVVTGSLTDSS